MSGTKVDLMVKHSKTIDIVKNKKLARNFEPSMKTLLRILKTMENKGPGAKTSLSLDTNLNYTRLAKHIVWLEKKGLVESTVNKSKINVGLTAKGRVFASTLSD
jgi:predicted transcriptional regulator